MAHANARTNLFARRLIVERVAAGWPAAHVAEQLGVSRATVYKWVRRHAQAGEAGLSDRSSRPRRIPARTSHRVERRVLAARRRRQRGAVVLAAELGLNPSTVGRILARHQMPYLATIDPITGEALRSSRRSPNRYEHPTPGAMIHVDVKKPWLAARVGRDGPRVSVNTRAHRLGTLRMFFLRIEDWGWEDRPERVPILFGDLPRQDKPLPKALDDAAAAKFLRAAQAQPRMLVRVVCEVLLRTGLRVSELTGLRADAVVQIGAGHWLHVPVGKLHDDRYLPLHPHLVDLISDYRAAYVHPANPLLLPRENGKPMDRHAVTRYLNKAADAAGIGHVHPHQMRHTLATQAINRGMSLEAIAALLGHHSMDMTLRYAKIANRTVADEYFAVTEKVEALYDNPPALPASAAGPEMARLHREMRQRMLGNGYCTRPETLDCTFESVCETCTFFATTIEFRPTLQAQHDHAAAHGQTSRQNLLADLLNHLNQAPAS